MSYITTVTGKHFDPMDPGNHDFNIVDIAHALSLICRGNGHIRFFYSVAQHSIACAEEAVARGYSPEVILGLQRAIWQHFIGRDLTADEMNQIFEIDDMMLSAEFHQLMPEELNKDYRKLLSEFVLQRAIWQHFIGRDLTADEMNQIFEIDDMMLSAEFHQLMPEELNGDYRKLLSEFVCEYQNPQDVKKQFIRLQRILINESRLREAKEALRIKENADRLPSLISELEAYYTSGEWKQDFAADEAGLLPKGLKRGVLSEDGIYNLLEEYKEVSE